MLPILSAVIIGLKDGTNHNHLLLATLYVVSMALTYAAFGALVASVGDGVQTIVKQDYIIIFLVFSLFLWQYLQHLILVFLLLIS